MRFVFLSELTELIQLLSQTPSMHELNGQIAQQSKKFVIRAHAVLPGYVVCFFYFALAFAG